MTLVWSPFSFGSDLPKEKLFLIKLVKSDAYYDQYNVTIDVPTYTDADYDARLKRLPFFVFTL